MARKTHRKEHKLSQSAYAREQLARFASGLLNWRTAREQSRLALASKVGCHQQQIRNIEKGDCYPSWPVYAAICREMGVQPVPEFPAESF